MATLEILREVFLMLAAAYPKNELNQTTIELYSRLLADLSDELLKVAVLDHISRSQWFPAIAELRQAAAGISRPELEPGGAAWGIAYDAMRLRGRDWDYKFDNQVTQKCIDSMGWRYLCMSTNTTADRARFIELYDEYAKRRKTEGAMLPMVKALAAKMHPAQLPEGDIA